MERISVFLADWQVLFREGIHFTLYDEKDMEVIGKAASNEEVLSSIEINLPQIAIFNINDISLSGIKATKHIKRNFPSISVILVIDTYSEEQLFAAAKSGASACFTKDVDPNDMVSLIRKVAQGTKPISEALLKPEIASRAINEFEVFASINERTENIFAQLSSFEADIIYRIAKGSPAKQIAEALSINEEEIRHHLEMILSKVAANSHNIELIEAAQKDLPTIISKIRKQPAEYLTREEFEAFKESLGERLKSVITELGPIRSGETKIKD